MTSFQNVDFKAKIQALFLDDDIVWTVFIEGDGLDVVIRGTDADSSSHIELVQGQGKLY